MKRKKSQEWSKVLEEWNRQLRQIQKEWEKKKTSLRTKVYSLITGLILIGIGGTLVMSTVINSIYDGNLSLIGFAQSFIGMIISFLGYIVAHKGLEGTWL